MKKIILFAIVLLAIGSIFYFVQKDSSDKSFKSLIISYPFNNSVFPADITAPEFVWQDPNENIKRWKVTVSVSELELLTTETSTMNWRPSEKEWKLIKEKSSGSKVRIFISGITRKVVSNANVVIEISEDKVEAPIFFRAVPLPFKFARENLKRVKWHLGSVSEVSKPHVVLDNIPVCANCHSFTSEGGTVAMDVDARDDKGAYAIAGLQKQTLFSEDSIIHWSDFQDGKFTYGLLSQISPDGRYVVSTLKDCEIFVDRKDLEISQLFFPFKGILVVYDRLKKTYTELEGANDTSYVHSNPCWTPDGKNIYFTKALAKHYHESGIHNGSVPKPEDRPIYQTFEDLYMSRDSLMRFDIYKIPFENGKGGDAVPVDGASNNGLSNYFPKISPDGKWLVFCQAESFMLLQKDSKLKIVSSKGGEPREMTCNTSNMNSWHSWSPNSKWLVFSSKEFSPYTQLFLTHINDDGSDSPPIYLENFAYEKYAVNIPEFVNVKYDKDFKINPTFLAENDFIVRNGEIKLQNGDLDGAFKDFDKAVKLFPRLSEPFYQRGRIYFEKALYIKAIEDYSKAISIERISTYYTSRGIAYIKLNQNDKVIEDLTIASKLDPTSFTPWTYLGVAYTKAENYGQAIISLNKAVELFDGDAYSYYYLGLAHYYLGEWAKANDALTKAVNLNPKKSIKHLVYELRGRTLFKTGDFYGAINDLKITTELAPNDPAPYLLKGKAELEVGLKNEALKSFNQAKKLGSAEAADYISQNS